MGLQCHAIPRLWISGGIDPKVLSDTTAFCVIKSPVKKVLKNLGLWDQKGGPPPKANGPPMAPEYHIAYTDSQVPVSDNYLYVDPQYLEVYTPLAALHRLIFKERDRFKG